MSHYAPMSTITQSLSVVMSDQVEILSVDFIWVEWWLGNTPPPLFTLILTLILTLNLTPDPNP